MFSVMADVMGGSSVGGMEVMMMISDVQRRRRRQSGMCVACTIYILSDSTLYHVCIMNMLGFVKCMMHWFCR